MTTEKKLILVVGATGAQGIHVIPKLLAPSEDGTPSPYAVRALTRDPENRRAKELAAMGVELFKGAFDNIQDIRNALKGCYGCFINTDTYTVGEQKEVYFGIKLFEWAKRNGVRHFIYSGLDYTSKLSNYDLRYKAEHHDGKGIVMEFLKSQESHLGDGLTWTSITNGPYMEMLTYPLLGPLNIRKDGTVVFASVIEDGHVPMIALDDLGWWTRYTLDNREDTSGKDLCVCSEMVSWTQLAETFTRVTGIPSVYKRITLDEWLACMVKPNRPVANEKKEGDGSTTIKESFSGFYNCWKDDIVKRDMEWIRKTHPTGFTLESWIREKKYDGRIGTVALKNAEDGKARLIPDPVKCAEL